jgi:glycosyltransferase involved in cell wall biosynthesis
MNAPKPAVAQPTSAKPTVAHLLPDYNPFPPVYPAGTELRVEQVARRQTRYRPVVICGGFQGQPARESIDAMLVRRIHTGRAYRRIFRKITRLDPYPYTARMWHIAREEGARLLHIHNEPKLLAGLAPRLARAQLRLQLPVVVHVANDKPLPRAALPLVTRWIACSRYLAGWLESEGIEAGRIGVIYTGVDTRMRRPLWALDAAERAALRRRAGVHNPDAVVLLFAGRLVKEKGVSELLDAFERLRARHGEGVELLVAGNVRDSDDPNNEKAVYGKSVTARIAATPGARWVGSLTPERMHEFLLAGDVFALPSLWADPFPTVMLEAAAAGLPIVAAARGGITEFLEHCPAFGFVNEPADPAELSAALQRYVASPADRAQAGRWLRAKVEQDFDWSRVCREFEDLYDRLLPADKADTGTQGARAAA